ncbi:MAG: ferrochelatase [Candidatus Krumholzibacteriia bacterium]
MQPTPARCVLLVNLGSPDAPTPRDLRRYLHQFLMDGRVIDVPWPLRKFIVTCTILPFRPARSAAAYRSIWSPAGSPLITTSRRVQALLSEKLSQPVELAMRYGNPSIPDVVDRIANERMPGEILMVPLYPHYAMSSYESSVVEVKKAVDKTRRPIKLNVMAPFYEHPDYIDALWMSARERIEDDMDHLLFSYHGLPERHLRKSDPTGSHCLREAQCCERRSPAHRTCYRHQVLRTTELLAQRAQIPRGKYSVSFQSRLGRDPWLKPATSEELLRLARCGVRHLKVICPAFVTDCLETLEEIAIAGREAFLSAGGRQFEMIPCLNDHPRWVDTLSGWCRQDEPQLLDEGLLAGY